MRSFVRDLPDWVQEVRVSAHACLLCGAMVSLDLLDTHAAWHNAHDQPDLDAAGPDGGDDIAPRLD